MIGKLNTFGSLTLHRSIVTSLVLVLLLTSKLFADYDLPHESLPASWKQDAELTDVFFLNADLGWSVGAQGVILRTVDGGGHWREISQVSDFISDDLTLEQKLNHMRSGVRTRHSGSISDGASATQPIRIRFESVHFVDEHHGWIAGGYSVPYVGRSRAVVMRTSDGGQTWESVRSLVIPRINKIHFSDYLNGWAVGESGNLFATGVFFTSDGGQTWSSRSSEKFSGWTDAAKTSQGLVTLGYDGKIGVFEGDRFESAVILGDTPEKISRLEMADNRLGWAVGVKGSVLQTTNGGKSWRPIEFPGYPSSTGEVKTNAVKQFDLRALAITPDKVWFTGDPGTYLFSLDRTTGETASIRMPTPNRINRLYFADGQTGWAVGAFGTILATKDGGSSWAVQRGKQRRVAVMVVSADVDSVPFEVFSKYASEGNSLCASVILEATAKQHQTSTQAVDRLGSTISTRVNLGGESTVAIRRLVRFIRTLQPSIIVLNTSQDAAPAETLQLTNLVKDAVRKSVDQNAFEQQMTDVGLKTWQVNRLAVLDRAGTVSIDPTQLLPRTGMLMEDQIAISRAIMDKSIVSDESTIYRVVELSNNGRIKASNLLSGLSQNSVPVRSHSDQRHGNLTSILQASSKQKTFNQFLKFEAVTPQDFLVWRRQVQSYAMKMESDVAGVWLLQLAERYLADGKMELAAGSAEMLVSRWSDHAFTPAALTWLAHYYGSDEYGQIELNNRMKSGQLDVKTGAVKTGNSDNRFATAPASVAGQGVSQLVWIPTNDPTMSGKNDSSIALAGHSETIPEEALASARKAFFDARHRKAGMFLTQLGRRDPELVAGSQYKLMDVQLTRQISGPITNERKWKVLEQKKEYTGAGVSLAAQRELALNGSAPAQSGVNPLVCSKSKTRPVLDGHLNEACWKSAVQTGNVVMSDVRLSNQVNPKSDIVLFAHDEEFLYVGLTCQKIRGHFYNVRKSARPRDADLKRRDRVELTIDVDRDYRSAYQFVVDHRGWVREGCAGSIGWNPDWFVSQSEDETSWTIELAIPLDIIAASSIDSTTTWAFGLKRRILDDRNVWTAAQERDARKDLSGFQHGLQTRATDFHLLRFETALTTTE